MHWLSIAGITFAALFPLVNPFAALPLFASLTHGAPDAWRKRMVLKASIFVFVILIVTQYIGNSLLNFFGLSLGTLQIAGGLIVAHTAWQMSTDTPKISDSERHRIKRKIGRGVAGATAHTVTSAASSLAGLPSRLHRHDDHHAGGDGDPNQIENHPESPESSATEQYAAPESSAPPATLPDISFSPMAMPMLAGPGAMGVVIGLVTSHSGAPQAIGIGLGLVGISLLCFLVLSASAALNRMLGPSGIMVMQRIFGFITLGIAVALVASGISTLFGIQIN